MSCYTRHLTSVLAEAGIADDRLHRQAADRALRDLLGMRHAQCPDVWHELKQWLAEPSPRALVVETLRHQFRESNPAT